MRSRHNKDLTKITRRGFAFSLAASALYSGPLVLFTDEEAQLIEALTNLIVPADDAPGAVAAGVVYYIDKQLAGPLRRFEPVYRKTIPLFRSACLEQTGKEFIVLPFAAQTTWLRQSEPPLSPALASFFALVIDHTMQGFYGSPQYGGNRDEASWKMLAIEDVMEGHKH
jgi:gluconate 2-dehydrogenase gamma chain